jgi:hypothetical protein
VPQVPGGEGEFEAEAHSGLHCVLHVDPGALGSESDEDPAGLEGTEGVEGQDAAVEEHLDLRPAADEIGPQAQLEGGDGAEPQASLLEPALDLGRPGLSSSQEIDDQVGVDDYEAVGQRCRRRPEEAQGLQAEPLTAASGQIRTGEQEYATGGRIRKRFAPGEQPGITSRLGALTNEQATAPRLSRTFE